MLLPRKKPGFSIIKVNGEKVNEESELENNIVTHQLNRMPKIAHIAIYFLDFEKIVHFAKHILVRFQTNNTVMKRSNLSRIFCNLKMEHRLS
jgi:hypothetical protein